MGKIERVHHMVVKNQVFARCVFEPDIKETTLNVRTNSFFKSINNNTDMRLENDAKTKKKEFSTNIKNINTQMNKSMRTQTWIKVPRETE